MNKNISKSLALAAPIVLLALLTISIITLCCEPAWASTSVSVSSQDDLQKAINEAASNECTEIILPGSLTIDNTIVIPSDKVIVLKSSHDGSTINVNNKGGSSYWWSFNIESDATLTYTDGIKTVLNNTNFVKSSGTFNMKGGTITGGCNSCLNSGLLNFEGDTAHFNMTGGTIKSNTVTNAGGVIRLNSGAHGTIGGGTITDNSITSQLTGTIAVCGSHLVMNDGEISNNDGSKQAFASGGVFVFALKTSTREASDSDFVMNGGVISNNKSAFGAGVYVLGGSPVYGDFESTAHFTMNGGSICNNEATGYASTNGSLAGGGGGGVYVDSAGNFAMNDGSISNNSVYGVGGGVATYDQFVSYFGKIDYKDATKYGSYYTKWPEIFPASFTMKGGRITGNSAYGNPGCGGGVYCGSANNTIEAGLIQNNSAARQGGGLYVGSVPYVLNIADSIITDNTAEIIGGGTWFCPTGRADYCVNNGSAVYNNTAGDAGDDVAIVRTSDSTASSTASIADRILGGGYANWYEDGAIMPSALGTGDPGTARFTAGSDNNTAISGISDSLEEYALKSQPSSKAIAKAKKTATVIISGNSAPRGGGVGSNGQVNFGDDYPYYENPDEEPEESIVPKISTSPIPDNSSSDTAVTTTKVASAEASPSTGDSSALPVLTVILFLSVAGVALITFSIYRRN